MYTVCNIALASVDNWLRLPTIAVPAHHRRAPNNTSSAPPALPHRLRSRGTSGDSDDAVGGADDVMADGIRLYVELRFTMRRCTNYPDPGLLQSCRESLKLLARESSTTTSSRSSDWDHITGYRMVSVVAADHVYTEAADAASMVNVETKGLTVSAGSDVELALRDEGTCSTLLGIRVYYVVCDAVVADFAKFPTSVTGPELTSVVQVTSRCALWTGRGVFNERSSG